VVSGRVAHQPMVAAAQKREAFFFCCWFVIKRLEVSRLLKEARVNVILLPLKFDPMAEDVKHE
jgi:hypothetical protein